MARVIYPPPPISIHSLRMEGDQAVMVNMLWRANFNPLPPHGGRRLRHVTTKSTTIISIHSLRMEGDYISYVNAD